MKNEKKPKRPWLVREIYSSLKESIWGSPFEFYVLHKAWKNNNVKFPYDQIWTQNLAGSTAFPTAQEENFSYERQVLIDFHLSQHHAGRQVSKQSYDHNRK